MMPRTPTDWLFALAALMGGMAVFLAVFRGYPRGLMERVRSKREAGQPSLKELIAQGKRPPPKNAFRAALLEMVGDLCTLFVGAAWAAKMQRRFLSLGQPEYRPQDFRAQQILVSVLFFAWGATFFGLLKQPVWFALPLFPVGFFFPYWTLRERIRKRHKAIIRALPYHVDLLTLSVEAGLDFGGAMQTVVDKGQPGPLLEELGIMLREMKLGKTREESLRALADRVQLTQMSTFVSNIIQADKMGTSLGKVLRIQSGQMRVDRRQRAEQLANEAPVKMLLPLVICFFPTVFMVLFGPIVYRLFFGGGLHG